MFRRVLGAWMAALVIVSSLALSQTANALTLNDIKCRKLLGKGVRILANVFLREQAKCQKPRMLGVLPPATVCDDPTDVSFPATAKDQPRQGQAVAHRRARLCAHHRAALRPRLSDLHSAL